ncbi:hypothetical protein [Pseudonocardia sp. N23]|uniref:hypothetical protein n=1 Tax=Pseudonocardia sp. N23 TaxID=1987376 RepID=UPI000BFDB889|nr:hypothetical protein [Pseudonocardia sp. N23]GAY09383.1 hypothetical protein TOK_3362 [Pseudonocardia sp. N23]
MSATPPGTHQGVPGAHLTFLFCLDGTIDVIETPDGRGTGSFDVMVAGLHDRPAVMAPTSPPAAGTPTSRTWRATSATSPG